ncbi:unnamed protein product [Aureobasidium vineae]|uniref:Glutathione S-transferase n=1 Tax=Aureobasidium vineae TaxID=2773715 RepID=A0A9N8JI56_9PEZI|nr:unnamed protein product [Aureobasidium vineae]
MAIPKIKFYTNHRCPYAHRVNITLRELKLPFEEVVIDLDVPRPQWYLDINPQGAVPAIEYSEQDSSHKQIVTESAEIAQFLCEKHPSPLLPALGQPNFANRRERMDHFIEVFNTKILRYQFKVMRASNEDEQQTRAKEWADVMSKELEPLLEGATPFLAESKDLTFAEVLAAPFVVRWYILAKDGVLLPSSFKDSMDALPNFSRWRQAIETRESVMGYDEQEVIDTLKKALNKK